MTEVFLETELTLGMKYCHLGAGPCPARRAIQRPSPRVWLVPITGSGGNHHGVLSMSLRMRRRARELADGDPGNGGVLGMDHRELLHRCRPDHLTDSCYFSSFVRHQSQVEFLRVGDDIEHPAPRDVYRHRTQCGHFDDRIEVGGERRDVLEGDVGDLAIRHVRTNTNQACGRLQLQLRHRLADRHHPRFDQHCSYTDRIGAGHGGVLRLFHDHETGVCLRIRGRQYHVTAHCGIAARFPQHELAQAICVLLEVSFFLEHRVARHV